MRRTLNWMKKALLTHQAMAAFLICLMIAFAARMLCDNSYVCNFGCDVDEYNTFSETFVRDGRFAFTNYLHTFRGYLFPFVLFLIYGAGNLIGLGRELSIAFASIAFSSYIFAAILPNMFMKKRTYVTLLMRILPFGVFLFFWSDLLFYPLSDFWAFAFCLLAAYLLSKNDVNSQCPAGKLKDTLIKGVAAGALLYMAYNTRTIYLYAGALLVPACIIINRNVGSKRLFALALACCAGILLLAAPQMAINAQYTGKASLKVMTEVYTGGEKSIADLQLNGGITVQRVEGQIINSVPRYIMFMDEAGKAVLAREGLERVETVPQYVALLFKYPLTFLGIYARHAINMTHMAFRHYYIEDFRPDAWSTILNYALLFFCLVGLQKKCMTAGVKETFLGSPAKIYALLLLIPCALLLAGGVEMRFFMPAYVICYCYIAYSLINKDMMKYIKKNWLMLLIAFILIFACLCAVWGNTFISVEDELLL